MGSRCTNGQPHTLIYGAGAVGSLLGGILAAGGIPVTLLGRTALADAVTERGLIIRDADGERTVPVDVITRIDELRAPVDLVLLTTKTYAVADAVPDLAHLAAAGAAIVPLQNGVGSDDRLQALPEITDLAAGTVTVSVSAEGPGIVRQETHGGGVTLAPVRGQVPLDRLAGTLTAGGLPVWRVDDEAAMRWSKLLLNIMANATAAILAQSPAAIYRDPRLFRLERTAFLEALAVMRARRIKPLALPGYNVPLLARVMRLPAPLAQRLLAERTARGRGDKRPSLWLDVDAGRGITEVEWLNGAVARTGRIAGIPTPVNTGLTRLVNTIAVDPTQRHAFAGQPEALLAFLRKTPRGAPY